MIPSHAHQLSLLHVAQKLVTKSSCCGTAVYNTQYLLTVSFLKCSAG